jgi:hypothetical protein
MANRAIFEVTSNGVTLVSIEYNDVNLRVGSAFFTVPPGITAMVRIWDDGVLKLDTMYQPGSYEENVPGNYRVVEMIDPEDGTPYVTMPPEIGWSYSEIPIP